MRSYLIVFIFLGATLCFDFSGHDCQSGPETLPAMNAFELLMDWYTPHYGACEDPTEGDICLLFYSHPGWQSHGWTGPASHACIDVPNFSLAPGEVEMDRVRTWDAAGNNSDGCSP